MTVFPTMGIPFTSLKFVITYIIGSTLPRYDINPVTLVGKKNSIIKKHNSFYHLLTHKNEP